MTFADIALYFGALFGAFMAGYVWGAAVKLLKDLGNSA